MMLRLFIFLIILVASVWIGIEVVRHPGYLLVVYQPWLVQMPLWFALVSVVVIFIVFYLLIDSIERTQFLWFRLKNWLRIRREHQAYSKTQQGLATLIEGRWKKAEKLLISGVKQSIDPLMNYLGAAKAAQEQGAFDRRDNYIQKAYRVAPKADLAIGLTQAELEIAQNQLEQAQATLNRLRQEAPYHPGVLKLLEKIYVHLSDWPQLLAMLPALRKAKVLDTEQTELFEKNIYCEMLHAANTKTLDEVHDFWQSIPKATKRNPDVVLAYVKQLLRFSNSKNEINELIRKTLKYHWQPELVRIYGTLIFANGDRSNLNKHLVIVGAWVKQYGSKPELLLILGKLCAALQLWGKAKDYFEKCLALGPNPEAVLEYGKLLEQLGEGDQATRKYREELAQLALIAKE